MEDFCKTVLEVTEAPDDLTDDQIEKLETTLRQATEQVALPPGPDADNSPARIVTTDPASLDKTQQVIENIGVEHLQRHAMMYLAQHRRFLQRIGQVQDEMLLKFEQEVYGRTANSFDKMTREMETAFNGVLSDSERISNPQTTDDATFYQDYLTLVDEFLTTDQKQ